MKKIKSHKVNYLVQNSAKSKKLGIWSEEYPLPPWKFRAGQKSYDYRIKEIEKKIENLMQNHIIMNSQQQQ